MAAIVYRLVCLLFLQVVVVETVHMPAVARIDNSPRLTVSTDNFIRFSTCVCTGYNTLCTVKASSRCTSDPSANPGNAHIVRIFWSSLSLHLNRGARLRSSSRAHQPIAEKQSTSESQQHSKRFNYKCSVVTNYRNNTELKMKCGKTKVSLNSEDVNWNLNLNVDCDKDCADGMFDSPFKLKLIDAGRVERGTCLHLYQIRRENPIFPLKRRPARAVTMPSTQITSTSTTTKNLFSLTSWLPISQILPQTTSYSVTTSTQTDFITTESPRSDQIANSESIATRDRNLTQDVGNTTPAVPLNNTPTQTSAHSSGENNTIDPVIQDIDVNELKSLLVFAAMTRIASRPEVWGAFISLFFGSVLLVIVVFLVRAKMKVFSIRNPIPNTNETIEQDTSLSQSLPSTHDNNSRESGYTSCNGSLASPQNELCSSNQSFHSHSIESRRSNTVNSDGSHEVSAARANLVTRSISNAVPHSGEFGTDTGAPLVASAMSFENIISVLSSQADGKSVSLTITCNSLPRPEHSKRQNDAVSTNLSNGPDTCSTLSRGLSLNANPVDEEGYSHVIEFDGGDKGPYIIVDDDSVCSGSSRTFDSDHEYDNFYDNDRGISDDDGNPPPVIPRRINRPRSMKGRNYINVEFFSSSDRNRDCWV